MCTGQLRFGLISLSQSRCLQGVLKVQEFANSLDIRGSGFAHRVNCDEVQCIEQGPKYVPQDIRASCTSLSIVSHPPA